ncbi:MAG: CgeB family protein [Anaerolineae bacterium]
MPNRSLRIFYAAENAASTDVSGSKTWYYNLYLPLCDLGHEVIPFDYNLRPNQSNRDPSVPAQREYIAANRPRLSRALLDQVEKVNAECPIDLFFSYFYSADVLPETIEQIGRMGITTVNWYCNGSYQFRLVEEIAPAYTYCLVPEKFRLADYRRIGAHPIYCQEAANPNIYKPYDLPKQFDVTFVGQKYGDRPAYIQYLLDRGIDVRVWGSHWQGGGSPLRWWRVAGSRIKRFLLGGEPLFPFHIPAARCGPPLSDENMIRMYSRSKVNLGFSNVADTTSGIKQVRLRDFEVPMSGGFYMVAYMDELADFFKINQEIICYHDKRDLADRVRYYLTHNDEREEIRQAGHRRALQDHTWHKRFTDCFAQMGLG